MSKTASIGFLIGLLFFTMTINGQHSLEFDGQLAAFTNYSPENELDVFLGGRYIPELDYSIPLDSIKTLDFQVSGNLHVATNFRPFYKGNTQADIDPYRIWARYSSKQFELRIGLQKIDFGSATMLRPLQWFNQIDPRDPLSLTNGVYGLLGRYYFLNNANIWIWGLIENQKTRGFDVVETNKKRPEFGGRIQYPVPKGEIAISYHHRTANSSNLSNFSLYDQIPEDRIGFDAKWDIEIGLWLEATHSHKSENIGMLTNQTLLNIGADYTFGIGNGLNLIVEHLVASYDEQAFQFKNKNQFTAFNVSYPLGLFDSLNTLAYYNWTTNGTTFFINYQHQFSKITGYFMAYYNPDVQQGFQQNELVNTFSGPGIRFMLVYNH
ncbi:MAG: hypothetical protein KAJ23_08550 [Maribacter sp.]|nr:hypothetical protein [Maribacter sp.]